MSITLRLKESGGIVSYVELHLKGKITRTF